MIEILFSIFYLSGLIKSFLIFFNLDSYIVDITLLSSLLLVLLTVSKTIKSSLKISVSKHNINSLFLLLFFFIWMAVTLLYTPSEKYAYEKTLLFTTNIIAFFIPLSIPSFDTKRVFQIISIVVPILTISYLFLMYQYQTNIEVKETYRQISGLYLFCGVLLGINMIILFMSKERLFKNKTTSNLLFILSLILMFLLGARGPIFFTFFCIAIYLLIQFFKRLEHDSFSILKFNLSRTNIIYITISILLIFTTILIFQEQIAVLLRRSLVRLDLILGSNSTGEMGGSVNTRIEQISLSIDLIFKDVFHFFFGFGIGSYGILENGLDGRAYPHNIFLEVWVELGLIGLTLLIAFLMNIFSNKNSSPYINGILILYLILNMLKSNSIVDIRIYFAIFALYSLSQNNTTKKMLQK